MIGLLLVAAVLLFVADKLRHHHALLALCVAYGAGVLAGYVAWGMS